MSELIEQLDRKTLDRLDVPKTFQSQQGLDRLFLQKILNLAYIVNDPFLQKHKIDSRNAVAVGAAGSTFTAPVDAKRILFSIFTTYVATATAGSRNFLIRKQRKGGTSTQFFLIDTITAGQTRNHQIVNIDTSDVSVHRQLYFPITLEPEQFILFDDSLNIDNADTVAWEIEYVEVPI